MERTTIESTLITHSLNSQMKTSYLQSKFIHEQNHHTEKVRLNIERCEEDYEIEEDNIHNEFICLHFEFLNRQNENHRRASTASFEYEMLNRRFPGHTLSNWYRSSAMIYGRVDLRIVTDEIASASNSRANAQNVRFHLSSCFVQTRKTPVVRNKFSE